MKQLAKTLARRLVGPIIARVTAVIASFLLGAGVPADVSQQVVTALTALAAAGVDIGIFLWLATED